MAHEKIEQFKDTLNEIGRMTGYSAQLLTLDEDRPLFGDSAISFCVSCARRDSTWSLCRSGYCSAAMNAFQSGEPFYQRCWAGLVFAAVPVVTKDRLTGCVSIGGLYFEEERDEIAHQVSRRLETLRHSERELSEGIGSLRGVSSVALRGLGMYLMDAMYSSGINSESFLKRQHEKYLQQREIAEAVEDVKKGVGSGNDLISDAYRMVTFIERKDREATRQFFSRYLARLLLASNWNLKKLKAHLRVLLAVLTSRDILRGADWGEATAREMRYLLRLEAACSTEDSCYEVAEVVHRHFEGSGDEYLPRRDAVQRVLLWLSTHFPERVTMDEVARVAGASVSTVTKGLKKQTGKSFGRLLRETRVAEARRLLATSEIDLKRVSDLCGFYDQSHFTRDFRSVTGLTPLKFRKMSLRGQ